MRSELAKMAGKRRSFLGTFARYGRRAQYKGPPKTTLCFERIRTGGAVLTDHVWFTTCRAWEKIGPLFPGDVVQFTATVASYVKGYRGRRDDNDDLPAPRVDYKLKRPGNLIRIDATTDEQPLLL